MDNLTRTVILNTEVDLKNKGIERLRIGLSEALLTSAKGIVVFHNCPISKSYDALFNDLASKYGKDIYLVPDQDPNTTHLQRKLDRLYEINPKSPMATFVSQLTNAKLESLS